MKSALVHGVLLAVALIASLATWTRDAEEPAGSPTVVVWERPAQDVKQVTYRSGYHTVELERRGEGAVSYLWGKETFPAPNAMGLLPDSTSSTPPELSTEEFPLEVTADTLFAHLARLRAVRDLGDADDAKRETYGLTKDEPAMTVHFTDGSEQTLVFGNSVAGGGARYVLDKGGSHLYVMLPDVVIPFEGGVGTLRLTNYLGFRPEDVTSVTVRAGSVTRTMDRKTVDTRAQWYPTGSETHDVAFGNFMQQMEGLWVLRYDPNVPQLAIENLVRIDYNDWRGQPMGYIELLKTPGSQGQAKYYMRTAKTIVEAEVEPGQGYRIEQDARSLFRGSPQG